MAIPRHVPVPGGWPECRKQEVRKKLEEACRERMYYREAGEGVGPLSKVGTSAIMAGQDHSC